MLILFVLIKIYYAFMASSMGFILRNVFDSPGRIFSFDVLSVNVKLSASDDILVQSEQRLEIDRKIVNTATLWWAGGFHTEFIFHQW